MPDSKSFLDDRGRAGGRESARWLEVARLVEALLPAHALGWSNSLRQEASV